MTSTSSHPPTDETTEHIARHNFRVMGTSAELLLRASDDVAGPLFERAEAELRRLEAELSRFQPTSGLEQLNDRGHGMVGPELRTLLEASLEAYELTDGRFNISVGGDLIAAGYNKDFGSLTAPDAGATLASAAPGDGGGSANTPRRRPPGYTVDASGLVSLHPGVRLDLGGIAKGWASDRIRAGLARTGTCLVNLGGDISLHVAEDDEPWPVGVDLGDAGSISIAVTEGGLATSGQDRRVWKADNSGVKAHHLINPATGLPVDSDIKRVTVFGRSCMESEVWAKALLLVGTQAAVREAAERDITAVIIDMEDHHHRTGSLAA